MYIIDHCALPTDKKAAPRCSSNTTWVIWPPNETAAVTFLSTQHVGVKPFLKSHLYEKFLYYTYDFTRYFLKSRIEFNVGKNNLAKI